MTLLRLRSLLIAAFAACFIWAGSGLWPASVAASIPLIAASSAAWGLGFGSSRASESGVDVSRIPPTAMFVPRQAPLTVSLLSSDGAELRSLLQSGQGGDWESLQNSFLADTELDYGRDVKPWLGEGLTLAVTTLDLDRQAENGEQPGYLLAVAVKDAELAREFLQRYWQRRAADGSILQFETVSGVRLISRAPGENGLALDPSGDRSKQKGPKSSVQQSSGQTTSALVGDRFLLFSNAPKIVRDAVANVQFPALNLASDPDYQRSLAALTSPRIAYAYANLDALGGWLETQGLAVNRLVNQPSSRANEGGASTQSEDAAQTDRYRSLAVGLGTTRRGLLADMALLSPLQPLTGVEGDSASDQGRADSDDVGDSERIQPARVLSYLPADSIAAISSADLNQVWQGIQPLLTNYPALQTLVDRALDHVQDEWKLDITREIFPWVNGEYGLGQLERPQGTDWVFVVERTSEAAQQGIQHLDELARKQGYSIGEVMLADREVTAWTSLNPAGEQDSAASAVRAIVRGVHAQMEDYELFATSLEAMEKVLQSHGDNSPLEALTETPGFKQAVAPLPTTNQGYLYVNWRDNRAIFEEELPLLRILELTAQPLFRNLKTVALSGYENQPEQGLQRVAIALQMGK